MSVPDFSQLLLLAHRRVSRELERTLGEVGASAEQWRVLQLLADETGRPIGELSTVLDMNPPTMTKLVDRMVAQSWVQRIVDEADNRRVLIFITDSGLSLVKKLSRKAGTYFQGLSAGFSQVEAAQLRRLLTSLASSDTRLVGVERAARTAAIRERLSENRTKPPSSAYRRSS